MSEAVRGICRPLHVIALLALLCGVSAGQYFETRTIRGTVTDADGKPVKGAAVKLKNLRTLQVRSYLTDEDGSYAFHGLTTIVDYEVKAEADGRESGAEVVSRFNSDREVVVNLRLPPI